MNAIVTMAFGPALDYSKYTLPIMGRYAKRIGADLCVIDQPYPNVHPCFAKFKLGEYLDRYERVIHLDADIMVMPSARNLFEWVADPVLGVQVQYCDAAQRLHDREDYAARQMFGNVFTSKFLYDYFCAGLMVLSQGHRSMFRVKYNTLTIWNKVLTYHGSKWPDQTVLNYLVYASRMGRYDLEKSVHRFVHEDYPNRFRADFVHYGGPECKKYIATDAAIVQRAWDEYEGSGHDKSSGGDSGHDPCRVRGQQPGCEQVGGDRPPADKASVCL